MEETPEEKAMRLDFIEWAKNQPLNLQEQDECSRADSVKASNPNENNDKASSIFDLAYVRSIYNECLNSQSSLIKFNDTILGIGAGQIIPKTTRVCDVRTVFTTCTIIWFISTTI